MRAPALAIIAALLGSRALAAAAAPAAAASAADAGPAVGGPAVLSALHDEVVRSFTAYHAAPENPAYFLSGFITEESRFSVRASFGGVEEVSRSAERSLDLDVRVGTPELDNTHRGEGDDDGFGRVPLGDDPLAIRTDVWLGVERKYRDAVDRYIKVVADRAVKVKEEDTSADFCPAPVETWSEPAGRVDFDEKAWTEKTSRVSLLFRKYGGVLECTATFVALGRAKYFSSSEGSSVSQYLPLLEFRTWAWSSRSIASTRRGPRRGCLPRSACWRTRRRWGGPWRR